MAALDTKPKLTPNQRAQLARAIEQARAEQVRTRRLTAEQERQAECDLAERLLPHICAESTVDRAAHAVGVARMVLRARG